MIVFRDQHTPGVTVHLLADIRLETLRCARGSPPSHQEAVHLLIALGSLESALLDVIHPSADGGDRIAGLLRQASVAVGHVVWHTWHDQAAGSKRWMEEAGATLSQLEQLPLPATVQVTVPEGYAYYAVYPEMYLEAAKRWRQTVGPVNAVCLGLRSIGTSLSAVVAAALEELGCQVTSYTLRPRGHPFQRRPVLTQQLEQALRSEESAFFLVIDEGPGISGSSLGGTADLLTGLGIEDDRIVLFPSWKTDGSTLRSPVGRDHWQRHPQVVVSFEEVWLDSGRLAQAVGAERLVDMSCGAWRKRLFPFPTGFPPVQPQHERRKYLVEPTETGGTVRWMSFAGLGDLVAPKLLRANQLAEAGFTTAPDREAHGFLIRAFTPGSPVSANEVNLGLLETLASFLAHISREQPAIASVTNGMLEEMVTTNIIEGLGEEWQPQIRSKLFGSSTIWCQRTVALDGRMQPHEWIRTASGYLKTDAVDHHNDHFFPGCQDIAWDVVSACLEFHLPPDARQWLIRRYRTLSGDRTISARLPLHAVTYLAFRLGYSTLAADTLGQNPDGDRFAAAAVHYADLLRSELEVRSTEGWNA